MPQTPVDSSYRASGVTSARDSCKLADEHWRREQVTEVTLQGSEDIKESGAEMPPLEGTKSPKNLQI